MSFVLPDTEAELVRAIVYHRDLYWNQNRPEITDAEYDQLERALAARAPGHPLLSQIGAFLPDAENKVRHAVPMLSLDKAYSLEDVLTWARKFARTPDEGLLVQPKYDGISAVDDTRYLLTRGDGEFGQNISEKRELITLESPDYTGPLKGAARGEILIRTDEFAAHWSKMKNRDGSLRYKNPRNATAGVIGLKNKKLDEMRIEMAATGARLTLVDYRLVSHFVPLSALEAQWAKILAEFEDLPYPQDGVVVKFADAGFAESLGATDHHPRGAIAYKFNNVKRTSILLGVTWQFGKNCLTPVGHVEPVEIGGTTIQNVTLHNYRNLITRDLQIGDTVTIERAGDVIPYISASLPGEASRRRSPLITQCPACGSTLEVRRVELVCPNPDCPGTLLQQLAASVKSLGIEELGEPTLQAMMSRFHVRSIADLFRLTPADFALLPGFAEKKIRNLSAQLRKARSISPEQLLCALNIPGIGPVIARSLLRVYPWQTLKTLSAETLAEISGIGPERGRLLQEGFAENAELIRDLEQLVVFAETPHDAPGRTVCFTGKMPKPRAFYQELARRNGFEAVEQVSAALSFLVCADMQEVSSKRTKAEKLNIPVMTLDAWLLTLPEAGTPSAEPRAALPADTLEQGELF